MNMIIFDKLTKVTKLVENVNVVPRIEEKIYLGYSPSSIVSEVIYDFNEQMVWVVCGDSV